MQLVFKAWPVVCWYYFRVFACKNCNAGVAIGVPSLKAFLSNTFFAILAFLFGKIAMQEQQLCQIGGTYLFLLFCLYN